MKRTVKDKYKRQNRLISFLPFFRMVRRFPTNRIVGDDAHIVPQNNLSKIGLICERYINNINIKYENLTVDKYVIMLTELMLFSHSKKVIVKK